jgi:uncharacterized membrane protein
VGELLLDILVRHLILIIVFILVVILVVILIIARYHLNLSDFLSFLEFSTFPALLSLVFSYNALDEDIDLGIGMLPVADIELAHLPQATIDDE